MPVKEISTWKANNLWTANVLRLKSIFENISTQYFTTLDRFCHGGRTYLYVVGGIKFARYCLHFHYYHRRCEFRNESYVKIVIGQNSATLCIYLPTAYSCGRSDCAKNGIFLSLSPPLFSRDLSANRCDTDGFLYIYETNSRNRAI